MEKEKKETIGHIKELAPFISEIRQEEIKDLLTYGEEMKTEGDNLKTEFRLKHSRKDFLKLLITMREREKDYEEYLNKLKGIERERFIKEFLFDKILYSGKIEEGDIESENLKYDSYGKNLEEWIRDMKDSLQPGMTIDLRCNTIGDEGVGILAREWKDSLKPGMTINLRWNNIGAKGVEVLAKEWKDCLQPGMGIDLRGNEIGAEGIAVLAREWKDCLQPGMSINLRNNYIGEEGVEKLAREWKGRLQPGMTIDLRGNEIGAEGIAVLAREWKGRLQPGMTIDLGFNKIGDEMKKKLKKWGNANNCKIVV